MTDTYRFPNGYDVKVVRKQDIIDSITCNIVDKEVALALVQQCEIDAAGFISKGRWAGIPFMGTIRSNKITLLQTSKEQQELIEYSRNNLTREQYCLFKKKLIQDNGKRVKAQRYYQYVLSMAVAKNRPLFKKMCKEKGYGYARIHFFLSNSICAVDNEYVPVEDGENSND